MKLGEKIKLVRKQRGMTQLNRFPLLNPVTPV